MSIESPALAKFHALLHKELVTQGKAPSCLTCQHFRGLDPFAHPSEVNVEKCGKYGVLPPAEVIVFGCEQWEVDVNSLLIPF